MPTVLLRLMAFRLFPWALALSSVWGWYVLWTEPSNFHAFQSFRLIERICPDEPTWAVGFALGGGSFAAGYIWNVARRDSFAAFLLAWAGQAIMVLLWGLFALATVIANPDTLFGGFAMAFSLAAALNLIRYGGLARG